MPISGAIKLLRTVEVHRVVVAQAGIRGPGGGPAYVHTKTTPSSTWTVQHNLGRNPKIAVFVGGAEVFAPITYPDVNTAIIEFGSAESGQALCY